MTTTNLSSYASTYGVGRRHVHFDVRSSTPTSGAVYEGIGEWRVERGGSIIHRTNNSHEFAWLGLDGDVVWARFTDFDDNAGDWEPYTFSVTGTHAATFYINGSTGNDTTGDGSSGSPWATIGKGVTELRAVLTSGQVGALYIAEGQTYDLGGASAHSAENTTERRIDFLRWGTSTTRPVISNTSGFATGTKGKFRVEDIDIQLDAFGRAFDLTRSGGVVADRRPYDVIVRLCDVSAGDRGISFDDLTVTGSDRSVCSFVALENVTIEDVGTFPMYGYAYPQHWLLRDVTIGDHATQSPFRCGIFARSFFERFDVLPSAASATNAMRIIMGDGSGEAALHLCSFVKCTWRLRSNFGVRLESDGVANWVNDLTVADCHIESETQFGWEVEANVAGMVWARTVFRGTKFRGNCATFWNTNAAWSSGYEDILFIDCAASRRTDWAAEGVLVRTGSDASAFATGCFRGYGCAGYWTATGNNGTRSLFQVPSAGAVGTVENCHVGKIDDPGGTQGIVNGSAPTGTNTSTVSTTFNWTNNGATFGAFDPTLTADSGPLAGTGYPRSYAIDAAGFLRSTTTPDAGPYEFGASLLPDDPALNTNNPITRYNYFISLGD